MGAGHILIIIIFAVLVFFACRRLIKHGHCKCCGGGACPGCPERNKKR